MTLPMTRMPGRRAAAVVIALVVAGIAVAVLSSRSSHYTVTASFPRTVGLYAGDDVRVVGVPIGTISKITAEGDHVDVTMSLDRDTPVSAETGAVIVPPGVLSARYVQLTKPWLHGPRLANGARISADRTSAPLELDDVTRQLDRFLEALGPSSAGQQGALSNVLGAAAGALNGNGNTLRQSLSDLANALDTVGNSRGDIVATIEQLQTFVTTLAGSDQSIRVFEQSLSQVSGQLASQRSQLRAAIRNIRQTVAVVDGFV